MRNKLLLAAALSLTISIPSFAYAGTLGNASLGLKMAIDDQGNAFTPSSDPLLETATPFVANYKLSSDEKDLSGLDGLLSNEKIFGVDLIKIGMADLVKKYFTELSSGVGAVEATLKKYIA